MEACGYTDTWCNHSIQFTIIYRAGQKYLGYLILSGMGPCTNDVSTQGGRGVSQFLTIGGGGCVISILEILTGGGGV